MTRTEIEIEIDSIENIDEEDQRVVKAQDSETEEMKLGNRKKKKELIRKKNSQKKLKRPRMKQQTNLRMKWQKC